MKSALKENWSTDKASSARGLRSIRLLKNTMQQQCPDEVTYWTFPQSRNRLKMFHGEVRLHAQVLLQLFTKVFHEKAT